MRRLAFWSSLLIPALAVIWGAWFGAFPLGIPGQWEWNRIEPVGSLGLSLVPPIVAAVLYIGFVWLGERRIERCRAAELSAWMCGLIVGGFTWLWIVQESAPETYQLSKAAWVLYFRGSSGYFSEARDAAGDLPAYLAGYEARMAEGDVLHIGTHPPGLAIVFRALLAACASFPRLTDVVLTTEPDSVREAFDELRRTALRPPNFLEREHEAVLWLAALLLQAGVALTVVPLFGLLRRTLSRRASWLGAAFWPAVPALAIFIPKSDCLYPLVATGFLWLWLTGLDRRSLVLAGLAGFIFWLGMVLSLAFVPVALVALLLTIGSALCRDPATGQAIQDPAPAPSADNPLMRGSLPKVLVSYVPVIASAAAGFLAPGLMAWIVLRINLLHVWSLNFQNHAAFYGQYPRTYWKWLLVSPVEFAVAAGVPLTVLAMWAIFRQRRNAPGCPAGHVWAWLATFGLLWLSGKNMGEAARLWIIFVPFLVWTAASLFDPPSAGAEGRTRPDLVADGPLKGAFFSERAWMPALAIQLATTIALVSRVVGFHYP